LPTGKKASKYTGPSKTKPVSVDKMNETNGVESLVSPNKDKEDKLATNSRKPNPYSVVDTESIPANSYGNGLSNKAKRWHRKLSK
jgi:hypothetical protein